MTGLDPILTACRLGWDDTDPWGSGMSVLGTCCDLLTLIDGDTTGHRIPAEVGYRPAMGLDLTGLVVPSGDSGGPDYVFEEFQAQVIAETLGFAVFYNGEIDEPDLFASGQAWNAAPDALLRTITTLHRYLNLVDAAGKSY